jgi:cytosine/adenosine deaminase-related metal-dependent hydrolase
MIVRARTVVTMNGPPIEDGAVVVDAGRIIDVGPFADVQSRRSGEVVDLGDQALLPGLINAHCHLDYTCLRAQIPRLESFTDWIKSINGAKAKLSPDDYLKSINEGFAEAIRFGTTTVCNLTSVPHVLPQLTPPIRTCWFAELIDVRGAERANDIVARAFQIFEHARLTQKSCWGLAPHAPFTASSELYRRSTEIAPLITTHVAESAEEMQMFRDAAGPLYDFLESIGRDMSDCGNRTPLQEFLQRVGDRCLPKSIVAHLNEMTERDFELVRGLPAKFHVAHCPRSHEYFRHAPFAFARLRQLGVNICLGTDSLASNQDLSLFAEMRRFEAEFPGVPPLEILQMVTVNPARAMGREGSLGVIGPGTAADLIAVPCAGTGEFLSEIIAFTERPWVMVSGRCLEQ